MNQSDVKTAFARDLLFEEDSVVVFPSTMGITGEVFQNTGIRYQNNFGKLGSSRIGGIEDFDDTTSR